MTGRSPDLAILINNFAGGGAERVAVTLIEGFCDAGLAVDVVVANTNGVLQGELDKRAHVISLDRRHMTLSSVPRVARYLDRSRPPRMLAMIEASVMVSLLATRMARHRPELFLQIVNTFKRRPGDRGWLKYALWALLAKHLLRSSTRLITVSQGVRREMIQDFCLLADQVVTIYNPIVTREFLTKFDEGRRAAPPFACDYILAAGRLDPQKDYPTLIAAFAKLSTFRGKLIILGEGPERPRLEALAQRLGLHDRVLMPGFSKEIIPAMIHAKAFVLSSQHEGLSNVLIEALACGSSVVGADCPHGPAEVLAGGDYGYLVRPRDPDALASAIMMALNANKGQANPDGLRAHLRKFASNTVVEQYLSVLS